MARSVEEWSGDTDDQRPPPRVRLRVLERHGFKCAGCTRPLSGTDPWICDHKIALINGGENREKNLQPLCDWCEPSKTTADVAEKSKVYQMTIKNHCSLRYKSANPIPGSKASGWYKPMNGSPQRRQST